MSAILLVVSAAHGLSPERLLPQPDRIRCYGGEPVKVRVLASKTCKSVRWVARVAGAKLDEGKAVPEDGLATFAVRMPEVKRRTVVRILVQETSPPSLTGGCGIRVYPAYDPARLRRLFASASIGVAEARDEISSRLSPFDCRYADTRGRLALQTFEGEVLVASGKWWREEARHLSELLRAQLRRGVRIIVLEGEGGGMDFAGAPHATRTSGHVIADPWHHVTGNPSPDFGLPGAPTLAPDLTGNLRRLVIDARTDRAFVIEELPSEGGALLRTSLRILSRFEDPAAPVLLERCVAWAVEAPAPEWRPVGLALSNGALSERVRALGVRGEKELPRADGGIALVGPDGMTREVTDWVRSGGTAVVLVPGEPGEAWLTNRCYKVLRGVTRGLVGRLCARADEKDKADEDDPWGRVDLGAERSVLALGLLDKADVGRGKVHLLRAGPPSGEDGMPRAWREFLVQVFTNLGVRCGEAGEDE